MKNMMFYNINKGAQNLLDTLINMSDTISYSSNIQYKGSPVVPLGNEIPNITAIVGAMSTISLLRDELPLFT
ncbi:MAG TPA: hypothetical protein VFC69_06345, partial [Dysgonamonadaceae bacterium]|nr:hypothetical protein [Dysgonamonadaceae bacterium]